MLGGLAMTLMLLSWGQPNGAFIKNWTGLGRCFLVQSLTWRWWKTINSWLTFVSNSVCQGLYPPPKQFCNPQGTFISTQNGDAIRTVPLRLRHCWKGPWILGCLVKLAIVQSSCFILVWFLMLGISLNLDILYVLYCRYISWEHNCFF